MSRRTHPTLHAWAYALALGLIGCGPACAAETLDPNKPGEARGGEISATGNAGTHRGVISLDIDGSHDCTGVLISPFHALTAAHCTNQAGTGLATGRMRRTVNYYDPQQGKRRITEEMGRLRVHVVDTWQGLSNPVGWAGADLQGDLALIERVAEDGVTPVRWIDTTADDYQRLWLGNIDAVGHNTFYGGGYNGGHIGELSTMDIDIAGVESESFWNIGTTYRLCKGDSGGPYLDTLSGYGEVLVGTAVAGDGVTKATPCTRNGGRQYGVRLDTRIDWINSKTDGMCTVLGSIAECY